MTHTVEKKSIIGIILMFLFTQVGHAQQVYWEKSSNNYTTGKLILGTSGSKRLHLQADDPGDHMALFYNTSATGYGMYLRAANDPLRIIKFDESNNFFFVVKGDGNVGIGTGTPASKLHIASGGFRHGGTGEIDIDAPGVIGGRMKILNNGYVGIGTTNPDERLTVNGKIHTKEIIVDLNVPGPDYVFQPDYNLLSLAELEAYIAANNHLPEVPSAAEMERDGMKLMEMNLVLLKKVEELTLHIIEMNKQLEKQLSINIEANKRIEKLEAAK